MSYTSPREASSSPPEFHGYRSSSIARAEGVYEETDSRVNDLINGIRDRRSYTDQRHQNDVDRDTNWSYGDLSVAGIQQLRTSTEQSVFRNDSLATVFSQHHNLRRTSECQCPPGQACDCEVFATGDEERPESRVSQATVVAACDPTQPLVSPRTPTPPPRVPTPPVRVPTSPSREPPPPVQLQAGLQPLPPPEQQQPPPKASDKRRSKMAKAQIKKHIDVIERVTFTWDNNLVFINPAHVPTAQAETINSEVHTLVNELSNAVVFFKSNPCDEFTEDDSIQSSECLAHLNGLRKQLWEAQELRRKEDARIQPPQPPPPSESAAAGNQASSVHRQRLDYGLKNLSDNTMYVTSAYKQLMKLKTRATNEIKGGETLFKQASEQHRDFQKKISDLLKCATSCGDCSAVEMLDEAEQSCINAQRMARAHLDVLYDEAGLAPGTNDAGVNKVKLKPPTFSGESGHGNLDFYSFQTQMELFFETMGGFNEHEKYLKLKFECVVGIAKDCILNLETYKEAMDHLKVVYGKPELLFSAKSSEIKACGSCPDNLFEKRSWLIKVEQKLVALTKLATQHKILDMYESSPVLAVLSGALLKDDLIEFHKILLAEKRTDPGTRQTKSMMIKTLTQFLQTMLWEVTAKIDIMVTSGTRYYDSSKSRKQVTSKYSVMPADCELSSDGEGVVNTAAQAIESSAGSAKSYVTAEASSAGADPAAANNGSVSHANNKEKKKAKDKDKKTSGDAAAAIMMNKSRQAKQVKCRLCPGSHTSLAYCEVFQETRVKRRFGRTVKAEACYRCLRLDAKFDMKNREAWFKEHEPYCDSKWICNEGTCKDKPDVWKNHIAICTYHLEANMEKEAEFKRSLDEKLLPTDVRFFFASYHALPDKGDRDVYASFAASGGRGKVDDVIVEPSIQNQPIYMLQYVKGTNGEKLLLFYDNGCYGACLSTRACASLDTETQRPGPTALEVAGGQRVEIPYGIERFWLPMVSEDGKRRVATIEGLQMDKVSTRFPEWPLKQVWEELNAVFTKSHPAAKMPTTEPEIGGQPVDIMIGIQYNLYYPQVVLTLPGGLCIMKSRLAGYGGHDGILAGPHEVWKDVMSRAHLMGPAAFLTAEFKAYRYQRDCLFSNNGMIHESAATFDHQHEVCSHYAGAENPLMDEDDVFVHHVFAAGPSKMLKEYQMIDQIGADMSYRCVKCRVCSECKKGERVEKESLLEEREQHDIEQSVSYDAEQRRLFAYLPFTENPESALADNTYVAEKILGTQVKLANKSEVAREEILRSFNKLADNGFVAPLASLPPEEQVEARKAGYVIPWRIVHNSHSISTPVRLVFDGSSKTKTGKSLNDILCKGSNQLANLLHLLIGFRCGGAALSADIRMAYNSVFLQPQHYRYHKFLWIDGLSLLGAVIVYVVRTIIYGIKSSGNQTIHGFKMVADIAEAKQPELRIGAAVIRKKAYMDDIVSAHCDEKTRDLAGEQLVKVLEMGQQSVKAVTRSGHDPDEQVSVDGESVGLVGYCWRPKEDTISLEVKPLFLGKKKRGKVPEEVTGDLKEALRVMFTKRILLGKTMECWDPLGLVSPRSNKLKIDMCSICSLGTEWDEILPDNYLDTWVENLMMVQQLRNIRFTRSVFCNPVDVEHGVELIVSTDASQVLAGSVVHARMKLLSGGFVTRMVASKSKLTTKLTIPKAEMTACAMGCVLAHLVKLNFENYVKKITYVTDSMVALYWIHCDTRPLQTGIRNLAIEVRRFCDVTSWRHVESAQNIADILTRPDGSPEIGPGSEWQDGKAWMSRPESEWPTRSIDEITLDQDTKVAALKEMRNKESRGLVLANFSARMVERYEFSHYLVNPSKVPWDRYVRLIAVCLKIVDIWRRRSSNKFSVVSGTVLVDVDEHVLKRAEKYVFSKTTAEVTKFNSRDKLKSIGTVKDGIMYHHGRILPGGNDALAENMLDLEKLAFAKPVLDRYSPVAYSIMRHCHENVTHHGGSIATLRRSREHAFILEGNSLAIEVKKNCFFCRRYKAKEIEREFGAVDPCRLKIAPAYTTCMIDLFGPVEGRCSYGTHRFPMKLWAAVYKCPATLAVAAYSMTGYDTESFLLTLTRHINRYGIPCLVKIDNGTQLVRAFETADICVASVQNLLNQEKGAKLTVELAPVKSSNYQGVVERSIRSIKEILNVAFKGLKFTPLEFETALSFCCNDLNSMPLCLGSRYQNIDQLDLITPSRLLLGRNNNRAPGGQLTVERPGKMLEAMEDVERSWWEAWKELKVGEYVPKPKKWSKNVGEVGAGDIVLFRRDGSSPLGTCIWRIGRAREVHISRDGHVREVTIEYRNHGEKDMRTTKRAVRGLAVVHQEHELELGGQLAEADVEAVHLQWVHKYST